MTAFIIVLCIVGYIVFAYCFRFLFALHRCIELDTTYKSCVNYAFNFEHQRDSDSLGIILCSIFWPFSYVVYLFAIPYQLIFGKLTKKILKWSEE